MDFEWSAVSGAVNYRLIVSTSPYLWNESSRRTVVDVGNVTNYTDTGYGANYATYYWWVFAENAGGEWTLYDDVAANGFSFTNPPAVAAPVLLSPESGSTIPGKIVTYEWTAVAGAVNYRLIVSTSPLLYYAPARKTVVDVGNLTNYTDTDYPADYSEYYWWVFAQAEDGSWSAYSEVDANGRSFFLNPPRVAAPILLSPVDGVMVEGASVDYSWEPVADAVNYRLIVSTAPQLWNASPRKIVVDVGNLTSYTDTGYPANYNDYYWWVFAQAEDGSWSAYVDVDGKGEHFVSGPLVDAPTLVSPANGATVYGGSVDYQWNAVSGAINYRLLVSTSPHLWLSTARKTVVDAGNMTSYTDTGYQPNYQQYYWWVFAQAADGSWSAYSDVAADGFSFVNAPAVDAPALVSPADGATVPGTSVTYQWNAVDGAVNYRLIVSTNSQLWNPSVRKTVVDVGNVTSYVDTAYPANGTTYYWWVFAQAADGSWSSYAEVEANGRHFVNG